MKISTEAILKNPEILRLVPDYFKTKKMCKHAVKKLSFMIRYVPDWCKTRVSATVKKSTVNAVFPIWPIVELLNLRFPNYLIEY